MELSLNEVETTIVKAARGRGLDHGIAVEIGAAARWLCETGRDGIEAAAEALGARDCDAEALGLGSVDRALAGADSVTVVDCVSVELLVGLAGRVGLVIDRGPGSVEVCQPATTAEHNPYGATVATVAAPACWPQLEELASRTYVPSSEQSRAAGAGAGLTDND